MTTTPQEVRPQNLVEEAAERLGHKYTTTVIYRTFKGAKLSKNDVVAALEGQDIADWFVDVTDRAQRILAQESVVGVGPRAFRALTDAQIGSLVTERLKTLLENYSGGNLLMVGPTGCGKSLTAFSLLRRTKFETELHQVRADANWHYKLGEFNREQVVWGDGGEQLPYLDGWVRAHDLHSSAMRHPLGEGTPPVVRQAKSAPLLVIDDLQTAVKDDTTLEVLWHRYDEGLPTIATCGLPRTKCLERFGDAFGRRLIECAGQRGMFVDCFQGGK